MKVAVILSGCGHLDGAEIRESVLSLLYLDQRGAEVRIFAPDMKQKHVVNHLNGQPTDEERNVLTEAARIARGKIDDLAKLDPAEFDALVIPGGFGVAKNLSNLAEKGPAAEPIASFSRAVQAFHKAGKPIGAICIAPAVAAACLRGEGVTLTVGDDAGTAEAIAQMGNKHQNSATNGFVLDEVHRIASCSAYMRDAPLTEVARGIEQVIDSVLTQASAIAKAA